MTASISREHANTVNQLPLLADLIDPETVAYAFVASLGSRALATWSALGSYAFALGCQLGKQAWSLPRVEPAVSQSQTIAKLFDENEARYTD